MSLESQDALYAQLLGMGFEPEMIEECQIAMAQSTTPFSMQAATEWLLRRNEQAASSNPSPQHTLTLRPPPPSSPPSEGIGGIQKPMSSTAQLMSPSEPLRSRYYLSEDQVRDKERYAAKEREDVIRKARERKLADMKARQQVKQQIADDRRARQAGGKQGSSERVEKRVEEGAGAGRGLGSGGGAESGGGGGGKGVKKKTSSYQTCRVQVRLQSGKVLRQSFPAEATLQEVAAFVVSNQPRLKTVQLVQPFPLHEFTVVECQKTLQSLGLCPSASLVVSKQSQAVSKQSQAAGEGRQDAVPGMGMSPTQRSKIQAELQQVVGGLGQAGAPSGIGSGPLPMDRMRTGHGVPAGRGHVLGSADGSKPTSQHSPRQQIPIGMEEGREVAIDMEREEQLSDEEDTSDRTGQGHVLGRLGPMASRDSNRDEPMEVGDQRPNRDDDSDSDSDPGMQPHPFPNFPPPLPNMGLPPVFGRPRGQRRRVQFGQGPPMFFGGGDDEVFGGEGHKLGGKEPLLAFGDAQRQKERRQEAARCAAMKRAKMSACPLSGRCPRLHSSVPSLEMLCMKALIGLTTTYGLPACASLTPRAAHRLVCALIHEKRLNTKTLAAFHGCPLQVVVLDNYAYATNELLSGLWYFQTLTHLSLGSCTIITDKAFASLFPYLSGLTHLNLNGCRQLTDLGCKSIKCCKSLEALRLSQVKLSDTGLKQLLSQPQECLRELDLSHTHISSRSLELLPQGTPQLEQLSVESTKVDNFGPLCRLGQLHTLSVAHCPASTAVGSLGACQHLKALNLAGVAVEHTQLELLAGLSLHTLRLPDRNLFFDEAMEAVSGFPLTSLNLMDYCYITDVGIACLTTMHSLTELSLSRTKLTDTGMAFIQGLTGLRQLSLDNTVITDAGVRHLAGLVGLDFLSLSDTRITSQFILDGVLSKLSQLSKLNLSRTAVCDRGVMNLQLPSLIMLNLDWTCVTEASSLEYLLENGCPLLETLRNRNICQPLPGAASQGAEEDQSDEDM